MKIDFFVDNRDIRDKYYKGELIIKYNDDNTRHKLIVGKIHKKEALKTILFIMKNDLIVLEERLVVLCKYLSDMKTVSENLKFPNFTSNKFFQLVNNKIDKGFKFKSNSDIDINFILTDRLSYQYDSVNIGTLDGIYTKYKKEIKWLNTEYPFSGKCRYTSENSLIKAIESCKKRITECKKDLS